MPDLLHIIEIIDLLVKVGAWELVWSWPQVVHLLMVWVHEIAIVGLLVMKAMEIGTLGLGSLLLLINLRLCDHGVNCDIWLRGSIGRALSLRSSSWC